MMKGLLGRYSIVKTSSARYGTVKASSARYDMTMLKVIEIFAVTNGTIYFIVTILVKKQFLARIKVACH